MTQLELSMIGSCCFVEYRNIEQEEGHSSVVLGLWNKVSKEAKDMGKWLDEAEISLYDSGDEMSNYTLSSVLEDAIKKQTDKFSFDTKKDKVCEHTSFFEDEIDEVLLTAQDNRDISVEIDYELLKKDITDALPKMAEMLKLRELQKKEIAEKNTISRIQDEMSKLVMLRGTKQEIIARINEIKIRDNDVNLEASENQAEDNDLCFNTNLGKIGETYLDYEICLLPTMKKEHFIVTKVTPF